MAKLLIILGALLMAVGTLLYFFPSALNWFGRLPGDIRIERDDAVFYFPVTTMILISLLLSVLGYWLR